MISVERAPRILLLGEDNPLSADPEFALYDHPVGCAGWRLRRIFGLTSEAYLALDRTNLCVPTWSTAEARRRAADLTSEASPFRVIVALGAKVRGALARVLTGGKFEAWQVWKSMIASSSTGVAAPREIIVICLPHPSGRNGRVWADPSAVARARGLLRDVAPSIPWGEHEDK